MSNVVQSQNCFSIVNLGYQNHDADVCCYKVEVSAGKVKVQSLKNIMTNFHTSINTLY